VIYPKQFEEKTGFVSIKNNLKKYCLSTSGSAYVEAIRFSDKKEIIQKWLDQTLEFKNILEAGESFPSSDYFDLTEILQRIRIPRTSIDPENLLKLKRSLHTVTEIIEYFKNNNQAGYTELSGLAGNLIYNESIRTQAAAIIDDKGEIKSSASRKLAEIRKELEQKRQTVDATLLKTLKKAQSDGWAAEEATPTIRGGRLVIPVPAAHKRQVKGFIHDESATGQTAYIEPTEVFELNNYIRTLEQEEKREINRILMVFSDVLRPEAENLITTYKFLGLFDFIRAKARYALEINATKPILTQEPFLDLRNAHHPLLLQHFREINKIVVPLNIKLDHKERILVITGPNAGGKSVALKTIGLLQYMVQCGMLIPADDNSRVGIFKDIMINIGDEQSLENDLSTYSSHLNHLNTFMKHLGKNSLFLIDEFGAGTEPHLGGAIAEAVLETLNHKQAFGVITTHYANLKKLADETKGMLNGAMLFDTKNMKPLFVLKTGKPGSSFAFEIAAKIGFPEKVLQNARRKTNTSQVDFDRQLQELESEKRWIDKKQTELKVADGFLSEMIDKYEQQLKELEESKKTIIRTARHEAREIIKGANKLIEKTIRDIKQAGAEKQATQKIRKIFNEEKARLTNQEETQIHKNSNHEKTTKEKIAQGSYVTLKGQETIGQVIAIHGDVITIAFDSFHFKTERNKVTLVKKPSQKPQKSQITPFSAMASQLQSKIASFNPTLDVRGMRAQEAESTARGYIDEAMLLGIAEVEIIHGKGDGILRSVVREVLAEYQEIKDYRDQHADSGGHGVTVVRLK
jgi:DNA mismatch repair protein MutS2